MGVQCELSLLDNGVASTNKLYMEGASTIVNRCQVYGLQFPETLSIQPPALPHALKLGNTHSQRIKWKSEPGHASRYQILIQPIIR